MDLYQFTLLDHTQTTTHHPLEPWLISIDYLPACSPVTNYYSPGALLALSAKVFSIGTSLLLNLLCVSAVQQILKLNCVTLHMMNATSLRWHVCDFTAAYSFD